MVKVTIKTIKNKKYSLELEDSWTVSDVKTKIQDDLKLGEIGLQKLIHRGKILKNEQDISSIGVKDNDFIVVMVSKKKVAKKKSRSTSTYTIKYKHNTKYKHTTNNKHQHQLYNHHNYKYHKYHKQC